MNRPTQKEKMKKTPNDAMTTPAAKKQKGFLALEQSTYFCI